MRDFDWKSELTRHGYIIGILILATALRLWHLNDSLWYDEILTLTQFVKLPASELIHTYGSLNNHILYTWLAKLSVILFGETAFSLRLPAVLFGVGSIFLAWRLIARLGFPNEALICALLLSLSYHHVWFSQNARGYTAILFFALLGSLYLMSALQGNNRRDWAKFGLCAAAALLTHLSSVFFLLAQGGLILVWVWCTHRSERPASLFRRMEGPLIAFGICVLIVGAVFVPLISEMGGAFGKAAGPSSEIATQVSKSRTDIQEWKNPVWTVFEILRSFGPVAFAAPIAMTLALWGAIRVIKIEPIVVGGFFLSIPITLIALLLSGMRIWPRYFFVDIAVLLAAIVVGAFALAQFLARRFGGERELLLRHTLTTLGSVTMVGAFLWLLRPNYESPKQDFTGALAYVESIRAPDDLVVTVGLADVAYGGYLAPTWTPVKTLTELTAKRSTHRQTFIVIAFPKHMQRKHPDIAHALETEFTQLRRFRGTLAGGDILIFSDLSAPARAPAK